MLWSVEADTAVRPSALVYARSQTYCGVHLPGKAFDLELRLLNNGSVDISGILNTASCGCTIISSSDTVKAQSSISVKARITAPKKIGLTRITIVSHKGDDPRYFALATVLLFSGSKDSISASVDQVNYSESDLGSVKKASVLGERGALKNITVTSSSHQNYHLAFSKIEPFPECSGLYYKTVWLVIPKSLTASDSLTLNNEYASTHIEVQSDAKDFGCIIPTTILFTKDKISEEMLVKDIPNTTYQFDTRYFTSTFSPSATAGWKSVTLTKIKDLPTEYRGNLTLWDTINRAPLSKADILGE